MALSIDSMCIVCSAPAILAIGSDCYPGGLNFPLNTSAFFWTCDGALRSPRGEFAVVIMIEIEIEEMVGRTEFLARPIRREPKLACQISTRAKWRSSLSACRSVLERSLTPPTLLEMGCSKNYRVQLWHEHLARCL